MLDEGSTLVSVISRALDSWKRNAAILFVMATIASYYYVDSGSESAGSVAAGGNVLLLLLLGAVLARAIWRRIGHPAQEGPARAPLDKDVPHVPGDHWQR